MGIHHMHSLTLTHTFVHDGLLQVQDLRYCARCRKPELLTWTRPAL